MAALYASYSLRPGEATNESVVRGRETRNSKVGERIENGDGE